jgi:hypothetical protein
MNLNTSLRNIDVENLREINVNKLTNEVRRIGVGNRGSPNHFLSGRLNNIPLKNLPDPTRKRKRNNLNHYALKNAKMNTNNANMKGGKRKHRKTLRKRH